MSEISELPGSAGTDPQPGRKDTSTRMAAAKTRPMWVDILLIAVGVAIFFGGADSWLIENGWLRAVAAIVGFGAVYIGAGQLLRRRFGADFDVTAWLCGGWLVVLVLGAVFAPLLPLGEHQDIANTIGDPSLARPELFSQYPLGTNNFGLDLLARVLYGARASLVVAVAAVLIGIVVGGALGIVAGFFRKASDVVIGILTNSLLAVPPLILLIALSAVLDPNLRNLSFALSLLAIPSMIRIARANTLTFAQREFVLAAKTMGATRLRLMVRELLPNVFLPLASYGTVIVSALIVAEASLSFLGLGIQPPDPSWGNMIAEGEGNAFQQDPHIVLVPGTVLFLTVFSLNLLGEKARERFDPRQAKL